MLLPRQWTRRVGIALMVLFVVAFLNWHLDITPSPSQLFSPSPLNAASSDGMQREIPETADDDVASGFTALHLSISIAEASKTAGPLLLVEGTRTADVATTRQTVKSTPQLPEQTNTEAPTKNSSDAKFRKTIVMGKLLSEDTDWVAQYLGDWNHAIYVVDTLANATSPTGFRTKVNKAKEATPYLTYIVDHYDDFPDLAVFLHAHRQGWPQAWHTDAAGNDAVNMLRNLRLETVLARGYVNLRCTAMPGCPAELDLRRSTPDPEKPAEEAYPFVYGQFFNMTVAEVREQVPIVATPCCAQFAVTKEQVRQRPRAEYQRFLTLIEDSEYDDHTLGTVMEYMWHILFGRDAVHCDDIIACYSAVYSSLGWAI